VLLIRETSKIICTTVAEHFDSNQICSFKFYLGTEYLYYVTVFRNQIPAVFCGNNIYSMGWKDLDLVYSILVGYHFYLFFLNIQSYLKQLFFE